MCLLAPEISKISANRWYAIADILLAIATASVSGLKVYQRFVGSVAGAPVDTASPIRSNTVRRLNIYWLPFFLAYFGFSFSLFGYVVYPLLVAILAAIGADPGNARTTAVVIAMTLGFPFVLVAATAADTTLHWIDSRVAGPRSD